MGNKIEYVTTDYDMWNSADELYFFVLKGQVKFLPEIISPIIEDAINQGLLREPTDIEMKNYKFETDLEQAIKEKKIKPGKDYSETIKIYYAYCEAEDEKKKNKLESLIVIKQPEENKEEVIHEVSESIPLEAPKITPEEKPEEIKLELKEKVEKKPVVKKKKKPKKKSKKVKK